jgi:hypothetical protein
MCDAAKVWNKAPDKIRRAKTLTAANKAMWEHCKSRPNEMVLKMVIKMVLKMNLKNEFKKWFKKWFKEKWF